MLDNREFQISVKVSFLDALDRYQRKQQENLPESRYRLMVSSGLSIDLLNFSASDVTIEDIGHGLSNACRYAGQCRRFYSVAEHSILVSKYAEIMCKNLIGGMAAAALLHDAPKAYLGDVTSPLKRLCPGYQMIERKFEAVIQEAFGLGVGLRHRMIAEFDSGMYLHERSFLMNTEDKCEIEALRERFEIQCLTPEHAKRAFLERAEELGVKLAS